MSESGKSTITFRTARNIKVKSEPEYTGGSVSYYSVEVVSPVNSEAAPYVAECQDIIEALELSFSEGNILKALWRRAAARQGRMKKGYRDGLYDAEKIVFFGERELCREMANAAKALENGPGEDAKKVEPSPELVAAVMEAGYRQLEEEEQERKKLREKAIELCNLTRKVNAGPVIDDFYQLSEENRAYWLNKAREFFTEDYESVPKEEPITSLAQAGADPKKM